VGSIQQFRERRKRGNGETALKAEEQVDSGHAAPVLPPQVYAAAYVTDTEGHLPISTQTAINLSRRIPEIGTDNWCVTWKLFRPDGGSVPGKKPGAVPESSGFTVPAGKALTKGIPARISRSA